MDTDAFYDLYLVAPLLIAPICASLVLGAVRGAVTWGAAPPWPSLTATERRKLAAEMYGVWAGAAGSLAAPCAAWGRPHPYIL